MDEIDKLVDAESMAETMAPKPKGMDVVDKDLLANGSMSRNAANELTEQIRSTATATYVLVKRAYDYKAWMAMGYDSWGDYVTHEFPISRSRSYQLINQAKVIDAISSSAPDGTAITITEAQARDVEHALPKITDRVRKETAGQTPDEAEDTVRDIIDDVRADVKTGKKKDAGHGAGDDPWASAVAAAGLPDADGGKNAGDDADDDDMPTASASSKTKTRTKPPAQQSTDPDHDHDDGYDDDSDGGFGGIGDGNVAMSVVSIGYIFSYFKSLAKAEDVAESVSDPKDMRDSAEKAIAWLRDFSKALEGRAD